jgi:fused signal recognition particle receptor
VFSFLKKSLKKIYNSVTSKLQCLFSLSSIDDSTLLQLEKILLTSDIGVHTTKDIITKLKAAAQVGSLKTGTELQEQLQRLLLAQLDLPKVELGNVIMLVGINGSGKTTLASKLAYYYQLQDKKVLFVAADTFRAAAVEQLEEWAAKLGVDVVQGTANQDPASVVYAGCEKFKSGGYDVVIIDTAGRLQTKTNLMQELGKVGRVVGKVLPNEKTSILLTVDAMLGQNSLVQAQVFNEAVELDGVVLTKMDGTGKGGIVVAIAQKLKVPVAFISFGEQPADLKLFNAQEYVSDLVDV